MAEPVAHSMKADEMNVMMMVEPTASITAPIASDTINCSMCQQSAHVNRPGPEPNDQALDEHGVDGGGGGAEGHTEAGEPNPVVVPIFCVTGLSIGSDSCTGSGISEKLVNVTNSPTNSTIQFAANTDGPFPPNKRPMPSRFQLIAPNRAPMVAPIPPVSTMMLRTRA
uniref:Uncharacterized protein n=1 Tax=Anopheles melas TaxID=34690 RepID=A0A182U8B5_9DIPT